jgi:eukaryotic-like serine/threonine-protein kinase
MSDQAHSQIGRYRIISELGRGNMGVVYRAEDAMLNRMVAIKTILMSADPEERAEYETRFYQGARAAGGLNHPNIITIYDVGREGDLAYMAMELLEGRELRAMLLDEYIQLPAALDYAAQIADGIAFAHQRGVVHRDIKPANIMILGGSHAKIMDFGIARLHSSEVKTQTGMLLGSPKYMAPEQIAGKAVDHRADIFSLGIILYEMVTHCPPFSGADLNQLMYQVCNAAQRPPSQINPATPAMLDLIAAKALAKDPAERYQSATELAADLRACRAEAEADWRDDLASRSLRQAAGPIPSGRAARDDASGEQTQTLADATLVEARRNEATQAMNTVMPGAPVTALRFAVSRRFDAAEALQKLMAPGSASRRKTVPANGKDRLIWAGIWIVSALIALAVAFA